MCYAAKSSSQPHRLVPLANGMSQLAMTLTMLMIAVILPMLAKLRFVLQTVLLLPNSSFHTTKVWVDISKTQICPAWVA